MKTQVYFGVAALVLMGGGSGGVIAPATWAQEGLPAQENAADWTTLRPSFASRLNRLEGVLKGKRTVRVTAFAPSSPHARFPVLGRNNKVAQLRLDNEPIDEPFTNMPHEFSWNTGDFADGTHVLTVMLLDTVTRETETLDRVVVTLGNGREDSEPSNVARPAEPAPLPDPLPAAPVPTPKRAGLASRGGASRDFDRGDLARLSSGKASDATTPEKGQGSFGAANSVAPSAALFALAMKSDRPLMATTTALCKANGMLYLGLKTGGIAACDPRTLTGWAVRPTAAPGVSSAAPKALCADGDGNVFWLTSGASKSAAATLFSWNAQTKKVASVAVNAPLGGSNVTLISAGKNVLVQTRGRRVGEIGPAFLVNPQTGTVESQESPVPFGVSENRLASGAVEDAAARLDFGPRYSAAQIASIASANSSAETRWRQIGPDIVAQLDETGDAAYAYLPWNGASKDGKIVASLSDESGLWVATEKGGVRHITPGSPNAENGYDGYVRVRLTDANEFAQNDGPNTDRNEKIASVVEEWQGTPYLWGGVTKKGCDCSGFVGQVYQALGTKIPRSTDQMRASTQGERVHDELRYGDVLVYPGHVALYIGNGKTAETVGGTPTGSVSKSTIWGRREVAVRRYFH